MTPPEYLDFDLAIEKREGGYRAHVLDWQGAQAAAPLTLELSDDEINAFLEQLGHRRVRGADNTRTAAAKAFGKKLFDALFHDDVRVLWKTALTFADAQDKGLRLRLRMSDAPELADLPWELLYDAGANNFLNLSHKTPLVRFLESPYRTRALEIEPPLRILGVLSLPEDYQELGVQREWDKLRDALKKLSDDGLVELVPLQDATTGKLQEALRKQEFHILHFIGHGEQDTKTNEGALVFENERGRGRLVSGEMLGTLLRDARSLRLVVLNACEGARPDRADPFGGVAQRLIEQTIPAVIAMQFEITDRAARVFSQEFYAALADNFPMEAALGEARKAIYGLPNETEWATPVLYSRLPHGALFDIHKAMARPRPELAPSITDAARSFEELFQRAERSRAQGELFLSDTPVERDAWLPKFQAAESDLQRALKLQPDNVRALLALLQTQARLAPENPANARTTAQRIEELLLDATDRNDKRILAQTYLLHATLSQPPNEKLLERAGQLYLQVNDPALSDRVRRMLKRVESASFRALDDLYGEPDIRFATPAAPSGATDAAFEFNPLGKWNFQIKDETGTRLTIDFRANGSMELQQHVGQLAVPINGTWSYNPLAQNLIVQGVIQSFQPFTLNLTITAKQGDMFTAVSENGIVYLLTRD